jgi:hypothetical protein
MSWDFQTLIDVFLLLFCAFQLFLSFRHDEQIKNLNVVVATLLDRLGVKPSNS